MNPQNTTSLRVIDNSLLTDDTGYFVAYDIIMKQQVEKQKQMFRDVIDEFKESIEPNQSGNIETQNFLQRINELENIVERYKRKENDIDNIITDLKEKEKEQAIHVNSFYQRYLILNPTRKIENNILNSLIKIYLSSQRKNIKIRKIARLLNKLYKIEYKQANGKTFYIKIIFNLQTYHEIKSTINEIIAELEKKKQQKINISQLPHLNENSSSKASVMNIALLSPVITRR